MAHKTNVDGPCRVTCKHARSAAGLFQLICCLCVRASSSGGVEVGYGAPGYAVNFCIVALIAVLHAVWFITVRRRARAQLDHAGHVPRQGLTQSGYRGDAAGASIKMISILYVVWMQASLVITIASNYSGSWPYSPGASSEVNSRVTWDSFTRAFLLPWIGTFCVLSAVRAYRDELVTFYMSPCALAVASHVRIVCVTPDESGNPVTSQGVVRVLANEDGLHYVEWQLLRLVYCSAAEAFTAFPESHGNEASPGVTGVWAGKMVHQGGLTAAEAVKLMRGAQGINEIAIEVPNVLQGCVAEFYNMFYIYQLFAITISFYWVCPRVACVHAAHVPCVCTRVDDVLRDFCERRSLPCDGGSPLACLPSVCRVCAHG